MPSRSYYAYFYEKNDINSSNDLFASLQINICCDEHTFSTYAFMIICINMIIY